MRTRLLLGGLVGLVGVLGLVSGSSAATSSAVIDQVAARSSAAGVWGGAVEVPGTATLNSGGGAEVNSVSCASAGRLHGRRQLPGRLQPLQTFVVSETNGSWGNAIEVPGTATLNSGGSA